jgi:hypothetical protein
MPMTENAQPHGMAPLAVIVGASPDRTRMSHRSVRAHLESGYRVIGVHPSASEVAGAPCVADLSLITERPRRISVYVNPALGLGLLEKIAALGADEVWFNPGSDSAELIERARTLGIDPIIACSILDTGHQP